MLLVWRSRLGSRNDQLLAAGGAGMGGSAISTAGRASAG
jgi:hypothetical protein